MSSALVTASMLLGLANAWRLRKAEEGELISSFIELLLGCYFALAIGVNALNIYVFAFVVMLASGVGSWLFDPVRFDNFNARISARVRGWR